MAHILIGVPEPPIRELLTDVVEGEGHEVTVPRDFWGGLAVLRASLHGLVVIYPFDGSVGLLGDEEWAAIEANMAVLRRHEYIQITFWSAWWEGRLSERLQRLVDQVHLQAIPGPFNLEGEFLPAVNEAASRLAKQMGA